MPNVETSAELHELPMSERADALEELFSLASHDWYQYGDESSILGFIEIAGGYLAIESPSEAIGPVRTAKNKAVELLQKGALISLARVAMTDNAVSYISATLDREIPDDGTAYLRPSSDIHTIDTLLTIAHIKSAPQNLWNIAASLAGFIQSPPVYNETDGFYDYSAKRHAAAALGQIGQLLPEQEKSVFIFRIGSVIENNTGTPYVAELLGSAEAIADSTADPEIKKAAIDTAFVVLNIPTVGISGQTLDNHQRAIASIEHIATYGNKPPSIQRAAINRLKKPLDSHDPDPRPEHSLHYRVCQAMIAIAKSVRKDKSIGWEVKSTFTRYLERHPGLKTVNNAVYVLINEFLKTVK